MKKSHIALLIGVAIVFVWSGIHPHDRLTWWLEVFPAIITREVLLRTTSLKKGKMVAFLTICVCMAFSALYELFEWRVAVATGSKADAFLGSQSDVWDTQEDMATCLVGSIVSVLTLSRFHDRLLIDKLAICKAKLN